MLSIEVELEVGSRDLTNTVRRNSILLNNNKKTKVYSRNRLPVII